MSGNRLEDVAVQVFVDGHWLDGWLDTWDKRDGRWVTTAALTAAEWLEAHP